MNTCVLAHELKIRIGLSFSVAIGSDRIVNADASAEDSFSLIAASCSTAVTRVTLLGVYTQNHSFAVSSRNNCTHYRFSACMIFQCEASCAKNTRPGRSSRVTVS